MRNLLGRWKIIITILWEAEKHEHSGSFLFLRWEKQNAVRLFVCVFFLTTWLARSQFPNEGLNLCPRQWEHRVLTTGPPGNSHKTVLDGQVGDLKGSIGSVSYLLRQFWERKPCLVSQPVKTKQNKFLIFPEFGIQAGARQDPETENSLHMTLHFYSLTPYSQPPWVICKVFKYHSPNHSEPAHS